MSSRHIPSHTFEALYRYYRHGYNPGGFLSAVISDQAWLAAAQADHKNSQNLANIILFNREASEYSKNNKDEKDWSSFDMRWESWRIRYSPDAVAIELDLEDEE